MLPYRRFLPIAAVLLLGGIAVWVYYQSLVPAVHPDHDHGLENIAGGGFLRVERVEGGTRNLVGKPGRVLILHWFELGNPENAMELAGLVDYSNQMANDTAIEVAMIVMGKKREDVLTWARAHGVPTQALYVDAEAKTAALMGVRRTPETLIYDPEGHLVQQARGPMNWSDPQVHAAIQGFKSGGGEHQH
jgi:hypothetical protein